MPRLTWSLTAVVTIVVAGLAGCSTASDTPASAPTVVTAAGVRCDADRTSLEARSTVESVGGLEGDGYVVRFAQSTRLGVVALVEGDPQHAFDELHGTYGVALVARIHDDDDARVTGFQQLRELVTTTCG